MPGPTNDEQYTLELLNDTRLDPMGDARRYITSYSPLVSPNPSIQNALNFFGVSGTALQAAYAALVPVAPLAWNDNLAAAARTHDQAMITADTQSHQTAGESDLGTRINAAGYTGWTNLAENIFAFAESMLQDHAAFMVDWGGSDNGMQSPPGHRNNIMSAAYTEVGIGVVTENNNATQVGPYLVTEDFGTRNHHFVLGVAYTDSDANAFYTPGEGRADLVVALGAGSVTSTASGGYALDVAGLSGLTVTLSGGGMAAAGTIVLQSLAQNVKLDVVNGNTLRTSASGTVSGFDNIVAISATATSLSTGAGSQHLTGNDGNDTLSGGAGVDFAVYSGNRAQYTVTNNANGSVTVADTRTGGLTDGTDTLTGIERVVFADRTLAIRTAGDFNLDGTSDIILVGSQYLLPWNIVGTQYFTGQPAGPNVDSSTVAIGDFNGDGKADLLLRDRSGNLSEWGPGNSTFSQVGTLPNPGASWTVVGSGDVNGDGRSDLLFHNTLTGAYANWDLNGTSITGGGTIGNPGAQWVFKAAADFDGDGKADILFQNANGAFAIWMMNDSAVTGGGTVGSPGTDWFFKGTGDFNGDGKADILFENASGAYAEWSMNGGRVIGGGTIGTPGSAWLFSTIGDYNGDGNSDLLFRKTDHTLATWFLNGPSVIGGGTIGKPDYGLMVGSGHGPDAFTSLVFQNTGTSAVASWTVGAASVVGGGTIGTPGLAWTALASGDFGGTGETDVLFRDGSGNYAYWASNSGSLIGGSGGTIGNPGANWTFRALGDFNADGHADILFQNTATGGYANWDLSGTTVIGGGTIGNPGGTWAFKATGDFNGDGHSDLLFQDAGGTVAIWALQDSTVMFGGSGNVGSPGGTWSVVGAGDLNGDGWDDIVFRDAGGNFAVWDIGINGAAPSAIGGGTIGNPGGTWNLAKIVDVNQDGRDDLIFVDASGTYAAWLMNDAAVVGGGTLGSAAGWHLL